MSEKVKVTDQPTSMLRPQPLTVQQISAMQAALKKLAELGESKIITKNTTAEREGLTDFLRNQLMEHASELLGSWVVCNQEYAPLLNGIHGVLRRVGYIQAEQAQQAQQGPQELGAPEK